MQYINRRAIVIFLLLPLLLFLSIAISSCTNENGASESKRTDGSKESLLIGFSQVNHANPWRIAETTEADWDLMFDVNCKGLLWASQAAAKQMIKQGKGGKIINLASQAGRRGEAHVLAYCASKACVINMNQSIALALAEHKINVNALAPGIVDTPFWVEVDKQFAKILGWEVGEPKRRFTESIPLGRIEQPEDVAGAAVFLASSDSDYITQQCINVDGGNWPS